jgi:hypothetical protein
VSTPIDVQLREYTEFFEDELLSVDYEGVVSEGLASVPGRPVRGRLVAVATAVLVLLVVGGVALLAPTEVTTTTVRDEGEPAEVTETTIASVPVPAPGEGPKLEFVQVQHPESIQGLDGGYWFNGALYAYAGFSWVPPEEIELYRSVDGSTWEVVPEFDPPDRWGPETKTDGERLVNVAAAESHGNCFGTDPSGTDASIWINTSTDGVEWTSSEIPLPLLATSGNTGCFNSYESDFAVGPTGWPG